MTVKKSVRKATTPRKPRKPTTKSGASTRALSVSHKRALADGRTMSATVDRYLKALHTPKRRGRKVSKATLAARLVAAQTRAETAKGVDKVLAAQEIRELRGRIVAANAAERVDFAGLETAFVRVAKRFSQSRGIRYGAWRDAGVPPAVLRRAGISRASTE